MALTVVRASIIKIKADAIVNSANIELQEGLGVCGAIFYVAGAKQLREACRPLAPIKPGEAVITPGFSSQAKYIIHAASPRYKKYVDKSEAEEILRIACLNALNLAVENGCKSIALPLLSSGSYKFPIPDALKIVVNTAEKFLAENDIEIILTLYNSKAYKYYQLMYMGIERRRLDGT